MYLRSQGVDVPNVKVQLYYHGIKSTWWTSPFLYCKISFRIKALYKNKGEFPNFKGKIYGISPYWIKVYRLTYQISKNVHRSDV